MQLSDALHCMFWSLGITRRSLVTAMVKPTKTTPDTEAVEIRDHMLHNSFNMLSVCSFNMLVWVILMQPHSW